MYLFNGRQKGRSSSAAYTGIHATTSSSDGAKANPAAGTTRIRATATSSTSRIHTAATSSYGA